MDKTLTYRQYVQDILKHYARLPTGQEGVKREILLDTEHDHYQMLALGWQHHKRVYGVIVHVDIIDDKIWIQHDMTETGIANDLLAMGVPKEDIVLAFHAPYKWKYLGFGEAATASAQ